jgi:hypothetical protein
MSLASSASTASYELTFSQTQPTSTSVGHFSLAQESDESSPEYSSPAPNVRNVGNDASYPLLGLTSPSDAEVASYKLAEEPRALNQVSACPPVGVTFQLENAALPYLQAGHVPVACNICYACNTSCKNATTLAKHQNEFCERKVEWVCPACPHKVFGLQERLNRHHMEAHAELCPYGCDKREKSHSEACKVLLSKCSRPVATKKAWGCPCCVECFESLGEWSDHILSHPVQNEKVQDWSFSTMMWSLLKQPYLPEYMTWKHREHCTWSTLRKEASQTLRHALERHEVPAAVMAHRDYRGLDGPAALAKYAFNLGTTGKPHPRECKTPRMRDTSSHHSSSPSGHIANGSTDYPHYRSTLDAIAHSPAGCPLPAEEATFTTNAAYESEAPSSFRERVSGQSNARPRQGRPTQAEKSKSQISMLEDSHHLPIVHGEPGYHRVNGESRHMLKPNTNIASYVTYPPLTPHNGSAASLSYASQRNDSAKPAILLHHPNDSDSRRLQNKKSQANLHGRFAYNRDPTLQGDEAPPLPMSWQDPQTFSLEENGRGLSFDHPTTQRPQTASSRPATPARSEISQGSWTKFLNTSSPSLPGVRYSVAMSVSGPPSDVDMGWV